MESKDNIYLKEKLLLTKESYAPYKYALEKFVALACVVKEQCDPTIYCVLTAKSKVEGVSLMEFSVFSPKWATATNTFRPPVSKWFGNYMDSSKSNSSITIELWPQRF